MEASRSLNTSDHSTVVCRARILERFTRALLGIDIAMVPGIFHERTRSHFFTLHPNIRSPKLLMVVWILLIKYISSHRSSGNIVDNGLTRDYDDLPVTH